MDLRSSLVLGFAMLGGISLMLGIFISGGNRYDPIFGYGLLLLFFFWMVAAIIFVTSGKRPNRLTPTEVEEEQNSKQ